MLSGFYPSTFLQLVKGSKNSILNWVLKLIFFKYLQLFFSCLSRKTLDRFFILLHHCFYSCKPQIRTEQASLTIQFAIPQKNLCSCVQKIKNKHGGADVAFFCLFLLVLLINQWRDCLCLLHYLVIKTKALGA